jgi:DNA-binding response OmpR family regulator
MPHRDIDVLCTSPDASLLEKRIKVLHAAGFSVDSARTAEQIQHQLQENTYKVVLICHKFPPDEQQRLHREASLYQPQARIVILDIGQNPLELVRFIQDLLRQAA